MECKNTSIDRRSVAGVSLIELMVSVAISGIIFSVVASLMYFNVRSIAALGNYTDLDRESRNALDVLSSTIRSADRLVGYTTNEIILNIGGATNNLRYFYSPDAQEFSQFKNGERTRLLTGCTRMTISIYGRNTISNQFSQFAVTNLANAKMLQFNWTCERKVLGSSVNTENVQSAKIVIRKQN